MKGAVRYTLLMMVAAAAATIYVGCQHLTERNKAEAEGDSLASKCFSISSTLLLDSIQKQMAQDRKDELDYYLDRHNVEDEGYEMVAAFAAGQRHNEVIDTIPIYNIGRWKGKKRQGDASPSDIGMPTRSSVASALTPQVSIKEPLPTVTIREPLPMLRQKDTVRISLPTGTTSKDIGKMTSKMASVCNFWRTR